MAYFILALIVVLLVCGIAIAADRALAAPHPIFSDTDYSDDEPYLVASARAVLTAQPDPLSGIEHEPMGV